MYVFFPLHKNRCIKILLLAPLAWVPWRMSINHYCVFCSSLRGGNERWYTIVYRWPQVRFYITVVRFKEHQDQISHASQFSASLHGIYMAERKSLSLILQPNHSISTNVEFMAELDGPPAQWTVQALYDDPNTMIQELLTIYSFPLSNASVTVKISAQTKGPARASVQTFTLISYV